MRITKRSAIAGISLAGMLAVCLIGPVLAVVLSVRPYLYPGSDFVGMRMPAFSTTWKGECVEMTLVHRWTYQSQDDATNILHWFQAGGWLVNYRYSDATLLQSTEALRFIRSTAMRETYVARPGTWTIIVATTTNTLALGKCVPNPAGLPIP